jgi:hypothetical protein
VAENNTPSASPSFFVIGISNMFALALFLAFAALWVCEEYYPLGWSWQGLSVQCAFWAMPLSLFLAGLVLASLAIRPR